MVLLWLFNRKVTGNGTSSHFLGLALSKFRLGSANHRPGYFINMDCDWLSIVWAYSEQKTENGPRLLLADHVCGLDNTIVLLWPSWFTTVLTLTWYLDLICACSRKSICWSIKHCNFRVFIWPFMVSPLNPQTPFYNVMSRPEEEMPSWPEVHQLLNDWYWLCAVGRSMIHLSSLQYIHLQHCFHFGEVVGIIG